MEHVNRFRTGIIALALVATSTLYAHATPIVSSPGGDAFGYTYKEVDRVLGAKELGLNPSPFTGTADASAVELSDGRIRIYFWLAKGDNSSSIVSAISSDGRKFTLEEGTRILGSSPFVISLPSGGYRMYYTSGKVGVLSATSIDGLTFTPDSGVRLAGNIFHEPDGYLLNCSGMAKISTGYRMYCSQAVTSSMFGSAKIYEWAVFSATSSDLLTWKPDTGVRIGPESTSPLVDDANRPTIIEAKSDGTVQLIYYRAKAPDPKTGIKLPPGPGYNRLMVATSRDGLSFSAEAWTGLYGTEPTYVVRKSGEGLLYYGNFTPSEGSVISVAQVAVKKPNVTISPTPLMTPLIKTITCVKGKLTKKFTGKNPKCPSGWKKK